MQATPSSSKLYVHSPLPLRAIRSTSILPRIPLNRNESAEIWSLATQNGFTPLQSRPDPSPTEDGTFDYLLLASSVILNGSDPQVTKTFTNTSTPDHVYTADAMAKMKEPLIETPIGLKVEHLSLKREASCIQVCSTTNQPQKKSVFARMAKSTKEHKFKHSSLVRVTVGGGIIQEPPVESEHRSDTICHTIAHDKTRPCQNNDQKSLPKLSNVSLLKRYQPFPFVECTNLSVIDHDDVKTVHRTSRMTVSHTQIKASAAKVTKKVRSCSCKNSRCLKLYCDCFASSEYCNPENCKCKRCQNNKKYKEERDTARLFCMSKNKNAFAGDKLTRKELRDSLLQSQLTAPPQPCSCSKSKCLRKYCGCFFLGFFCSDTCGCVSCANKSPDIRDEPSGLMTV